VTRGGKGKKGKGPACSKFPLHHRGGKKKKEKNLPQLGSAEKKKKKKKEKKIRAQENPPAN